MTEIDHKLLGRIGAYRLHAFYDSKELTQNARAAAYRKFEDLVDPDRTLEPGERRRRAIAARRAHMLQLSMRSAKVRRERAAAG